MPKFSKSIPASLLLPFVLLAVSSCSSREALLDPAQTTADLKTLSMAESVARNATALAAVDGRTPSAEYLTMAVEEAYLRSEDGWEVSPPATVVSTRCVSFTWSSSGVSSTSHVALVSSSSGVEFLAASGPCLA